MQQSKCLCFHILRVAALLCLRIKCLIAMRAYSFLFTLNIPEILFPFKKISAHLTTPSTDGKKQEASEKHNPKYACDSGDRIVFEKLYAGTNSQQDQKQTAMIGLFFFAIRTS
jgi:hypothetical protein